MSDYCYIPPFAGVNVPPLVMLVAGKDHRLYYEAYNDAIDLDGDGKIDVGYKHSIDYYGYFDPYKCYTHDGSKFVPSRQTSNKYCGGTNEWSGNFLNWLTMARIDVLRKVLYGGYRSTDSASETVLEATFIPQDAHSWGKEYAGSDTRQLTPFSSPSSGSRHLFCITSTSNGDTRKIRVLQNRTNRIWEWASKERPVCDNSLGTPTEYYVRVKVCDTSKGLEPNCKLYPGGTYKPIGLLQKYGEGEGTKWCSKSLKTCNTDSDCNPTSTHGLCVDKAKIYFGLITGSYEKNMSGGVLRKNVWSFMDEMNPNTGIFQTSLNTPGNIVLTFNRLRIVDFNYGCPYCYNPGWPGAWVATRPMNEGELKNWGNPIAEMMYEALRYFAGKTNPTSDFTYSGNDGGLNLPKPDWGKFTSGGSTYKLYDIFPICAKPFMLVLSDINNSYDSDKVPGSSFGGLSSDLSPAPNVSTLANNISTNEGILGNYFIGQSGSLYDFICSAKNVSSLGNIRGLCPEEPTKQGSYYPASIAYYGNKKSGGWRDNFSGQKPPQLKTYSVALSSPIPDIAVKVGDRTVRLTPLGKSVSGCLNIYQYCAQKCTLSRDPNGNLRISSCSSNAYCPTNQIVDFYVDTINYDASGNLTYAKFRINFEDVEQGADHDMDAVVEYEIQSIGSNQVRVKLTSSSAAGCVDQVLGFTISGTTEDGTWLVVKDKDVGSTDDGDTPNTVVNMPISWERTFTVTGSSAGQLKPPLWYAAKWGGFDDMNNNDVPDLPQEWDKDGDGVPDNYFFVANPLKLEQQLESTFSDILKRASSGSTVATLSSRSSVASTVIQPYFYPQYVRQDGTELSWLGFLRTFWIDTKQDLREDTVESKILNMAGATFDKIFQLFFDSNTNQAKAAVLQGSDTESSCTLESQKNLNEIKPIFDAGCQLAITSPSDRKIYYNKNGSLTEFTTSEANYLRTQIWQSVDSSINNDTLAQCIIRYIRGEKVASDSSCSSLSSVKRIREFDSSTFSSVCPTYSTSSEATWKLGDIIYSTPEVVSSEPNNNYHIRYNDSTYLQYITQNTYTKRSSFIFVGANDGMLHAFRLGRIEERKVCSNNTNTTCTSNADCPGGYCMPDPAKPVEINNSSSDTNKNQVGKEEWAFIPRNALPYLVWLGRQDYCHVPTVDYRVMIFDASIGGNPNDNRDVNSWRTLLIGTMGFGGKLINTYSSSIFVLDLTDWLNGTASTPRLLWETSLPDNTLTTSFPAIVRLGDPSKNGEWYLVIGTGPLSAGDKPGVGGEERYANTAKLYFFDLRDGSKDNEIDLPASKIAVGDIAVVDVDSDYRDDVIYFGVYGRDDVIYRDILYRLKKSIGGFYRLPLREGASYKAVSSLGSSDISEAVKLYEFATFELVEAIKLSESVMLEYVPPVFGAPNFTKDENGKLWVFFGTGKYLSSLDKSIPYKNYFIGFKDDCWNGSCNITYGKSAMDNKTNSIQSVTITEVKQMCMCDSSGCGQRNVVYDATGSVPLEVNHNQGWYWELSGEAIYSKPAVFGGIVDAITFVPPQDICSFEGSSNLISLYYKTGTPYPRPSVLSPNAVSGSIGVGNTVNVLGKMFLGQGIPPIGEPFQISQGIGQTRQYEKFLQVSTGVVLRISQQTAVEGGGRFILWIEK